MRNIYSIYKEHYKALISLGLPIVIGQIGVIVLGFADTLMIGHHSTIELGAASFVNNVFNPGDKKIIGNSTPRYHYGINLGADWKGFDLGIFFQGVGKRDLYLPGTSFRSHYGSEWQVPSAYNNDYWTEENTGAYFPRARFNGGSAINQAE